MVWMILSAMLWALAALAATRLPRQRADTVRVALVVVGIPMLGLATLLHGPLAGLAGLTLSALLIWTPAADPATVADPE